MANAPVGRVVGASPPPAPLFGFRKAARTPPLSTAAAIITSTAWDWLEPNVGRTRDPRNSVLPAPTTPGSSSVLSGDADKRGGACHR